MDQAECDRTREAEEISAAELREFRRKKTSVEHGPDLRSELGVDHRQEKSPDSQGGRDDDQLHPLHAYGVPEQRPVHRPASLYNSRNASSRCAGSIVRSTIGASTIAARNG